MSTGGARFRRILATVVAAVGLLVPARPAAAAVPNPPNDPLYRLQYGPQQVRAATAWAASTGAGAVIAIVDTGIDLDHPDLATKVLSGATFLQCPQPGVSCGNGDWESGSPARRPSRSIHGTHVAGIAAAATNNGQGIAGVAPDALLLPVKVLDEAGGTTDDIARGVRYAADRGARVINLSLGISFRDVPGSGQVFSLTGDLAGVRDAIAYATARGALVVAAAGNQTFPLCDSPAFDRNVLCVAATDKREALSFYSNFGTNPHRRAVSAPGGSGWPLCREDIVSTVPLGSTTNPCGYPAGYEELAGTSMATPHVSGVAALLAAQGRSRDNVLWALIATARQPRTNVRALYDPAFGFGIVDATAAVAAPR